MNIQSVNGSESAYLKSNPQLKKDIQIVADADRNGKIEGKEQEVYNAITSTLDKKDDIVWTQFKVGGIISYLPLLETVQLSNSGEYIFNFKTGVKVSSEKVDENKSENSEKEAEIFSQQFHNDSVNTVVNGIQSRYGANIIGCDKDEKIFVNNSKIKEIDCKKGHNTVHLKDCKGEFGKATTIQTDAISYLNSTGFRAYSKHAPGVLDINQSIINNSTNLLQKIANGTAEDYAYAKAVNPYAVKSPQEMKDDIKKYTKHGCDNYEISGQKPAKTGILKSIFG